MTRMFKKYGQIILAIIGALAIIATALWLKDTKYENVWLYVFCIWLILYSVLEVYLKKKKDKDQ